MTSPSLRRVLGALLGAALLSAAALGTAAPASASPALSTGSFHSSHVDYVALGDSYAAGQGGGAERPPCNRTRLSYPSLLDRVPAVHLTADVACAGATTTDVLTTQVPQARRALGSAELVTLTVSGNDLNPAHIATVCGADPASVECQTLVAQATAAVPSVIAGVAADV